MKPVIDSPAIITVKGLDLQVSDILKTNVNRQRARWISMIEMEKKYELIPCLHLHRSGISCSPEDVLVMISHVRLLPTREGAGFGACKRPFKLEIVVVWAIYLINILGTSTEDPIN